MIKKYKKKPVVIEAIEFTGSSENISLISDFIDKELIWNVGNELVFNTKEGDMVASIGDFIIKEPYDTERGFYPCKPDIFKMTYEEVEG